MFDWVLNTPLAGNGRKSESLKKKKKTHEPSLTSTMERICKTRYSGILFFPRTMKVLCSHKRAEILKFLYH